MKYYRIALFLFALAGCSQTPPPKPKPTPESLFRQVWQGWVTTMPAYPDVVLDLIEKFNNEMGYKFDHFESCRDDVLDDNHGQFSKTGALT